MSPLAHARASRLTHVAACVSECNAIFDEHVRWLRANAQHSDVQEGGSSTDDQMSSEVIRALTGPQLHCLFVFLSAHQTVGLSACQSAHVCLRASLPVLPA
eukprot:10075755-Alexandrium_andersonii.AAC.1